MNEENSPFESSSMPERDPGGGGDPTFHQITDPQINNSLGSQQQDDINSNIERLKEVQMESLTLKNGQDDVEKEGDGSEFIEVVENVTDDSETCVAEVKKEAERTESLQNEDEEGKTPLFSFLFYLRLGLGRNWGNASIKLSISNSHVCQL